MNNKTIVFIFLHSLRDRATNSLFQGKIAVESLLLCTKSQLRCLIRIRIPHWEEVQRQIQELSVAIINPLWPANTSESPRRS